jgi:hypothetical protein
MFDTSFWASLWGDSDCFCDDRKASALGGGAWGRRRPGAAELAARWSMCGRYVRAPVAVPSLLRAEPVGCRPGGTAGWPGPAPARRRWCAHETPHCRLGRSEPGQAESRAVRWTDAAAAFPHASEVRLRSRPGRVMGVHCQAPALGVGLVACYTLVFGEGALCVRRRPFGGFFALSRSVGLAEQPLQRRGWPCPAPAGPLGAACRPVCTRETLQCPWQRQFRLGPLGRSEFRVKVAPYSAVDGCGIFSLVQAGRRGLPSSVPVSSPTLIALISLESSTAYRWPATGHRE